MTPVEERIDHERAKRIAEIFAQGTAQERKLARAYLDLLTKHSAREEVIEAARHLADCETCAKALGNAKSHLWHLRDKLSALPATEPAQPEHGEANA